MEKDKKVKYVRSSGSRPAARRPVKRYEAEKLTIPKMIGKSLGVVGTTLAIMLLIVVVAVCVILVGLAMYISQFADTDFDISLEDAELNTSSFIYAYDKDGSEVMIKQLSSDKNRVLIDIEELPAHVLYAFIAREDARFLEHDGVDWKRTVAVTFRMFAAGGTDGGSTITMQLVRDITGDKEITIGRKLREIFRALAMEEKYTKSDIMESYLNRIGFGGTSYGIYSASLRYFGKSPSDLTIAEAAILAGIVKSPSAINPYADLTKCREQQLNVLDAMYAQGYITTQEYDEAVAEKVRFARPVYGDDFGYIDERYNEYYGIQDENDDNDDLYYENVSWEELGKMEDTYTPYKWNGDYTVTQNWYVDAAIEQIVEDMAELRGIEYEEARDLFYHGGYTAYLNMDIEMQNMIEEKFKDPYLCLSSYDENETDSKNLIQGSFVVMNYSGAVLALVGGLGEKEGDGCFNRATQDPQMIGSTIKPLAVYSTAVESNTITYSTFLKNISGKVPVEAMGAGDHTGLSGYDPTDNTYRWPHNFGEEGYYGDGLYWPAWYAVQKSLNTIAVNVLSRIGLQSAYDQLKRLHFELDPVNDMAYSPLGQGTITNGVVLTDLAAAYAMIGNGGLYYEPSLYSKVVDSDGRIVLSQNVVGERVISSDTAWIVNRMMRKVVLDQYGTGRHADLGDIEVIGKTGTANDLSTYSFVGLTPSYIACYRISRDNHKEIPQPGGWRTIATVWHDVMVDVVAGEPAQSFVPDPSTIQLKYCAETGLIATADCPSTEIGYYRKDNIPQVCDSKHDGTYWAEHGSTEIPLYD